MDFSHRLLESLLLLLLSLSLSLTSVLKVFHIKRHQFEDNVTHKSYFTNIVSLGLNSVISKVSHFTVSHDFSFQLLQTDHFE